MHLPIKQILCLCWVGALGISLKNGSGFEKVMKSMKILRDDLYPVYKTEDGFDTRTAQ